MTLKFVMPPVSVEKDGLQNILNSLVRIYWRENGGQLAPIYCCEDGAVNMT